MASLVLGVIGAAVGGAFGNPTMGWAIGTSVGGLLFPPRQAGQDRGRLDDLRISGSSYGAIIPQIYGRFRTPGNIIWAGRDANGNHLIEHSRKRRIGGILGTSVRTYSYTSSVAVAVCEGPVTAVTRIWGEDRLIYDAAATPTTKYEIRIYPGSEEQVPDSLIESFEGVGNVPAHRGLCYVVFENLPLATWGNRLPNFSFEVIRASMSEFVGNEPGLQAYYRFSLDIGQFQDSGPNNYDLTDTGGGSSTTTGIVDTGIIIPSTTDLHHTTGSVAALQPAALTAEGWYRYKGGSVVDGSGWWEYKNGTTGEYAWRLQANPNAFLTTVNVQFRVFTNASGVTLVHDYVMTRDTDWHHLAVVYDTAGNSLLYVDGNLVDTVAAPVGDLAITGNANNRLQILGNDIYWDEVAVYDALLSAEQIASHHSAGIGSTDVRVADILTDQFEKVGLAAGQFDVTAATDRARGFVVTQRTDPKQILDPVLRCFSTDLIEVDGQLKALHRGGETPIVIPAEDLGAQLYSSGGTPATRASAKLMNALELPRRLDVTFFNPNTNYETGTQGAIRYTKDGNEEAVTVSTALVLLDDDARRIAEKLLYQQWVESKQFSITLPPRYLYLTPGSVLDLPVGENTLRVRIISMDLAPLGPIALSVTRYEETVLTQTVSGAPPPVHFDEETEVAGTTLVAWSNTAVELAEVNTIGLYLAANGTQTGFWPGCVVYWSRAGGSSYSELETLPDPCIYGVTTSILAPGVGTAVFDDTNTVDVTLTNGTLETVSDAELLNGENVVLIGAEYVGVGTVTALGGNSYRLSHLIRGQRGTDGRWSEHLAGEPVALIEAGLYMRVVVDDDLQGKRVLLKGVTFGQDLLDVTAQSVLITGDEWMNWAPCHIAGSRDGGNNLTVTWNRRDRADPGLRDLLDAPLTDTPEAYETKILSGTLKTVTAITNAAAAVVSSTAHGFTNGQLVMIAGVKGMGQVNGLIGTVSGALANSFTLSDVDTSQFDAYVSGGTAERVLRSISSSTETAAYSAADQTSDGGVPGNPVKLAVYQLGPYGRGFPGVATV